MTHPETDDILERLIGDPVERKKLYDYAFRFFAQSGSPHRAGLHAEHAVGEALLSLRQNGTLHTKKKPDAIIRRAITNKAIDAHRKADKDEKRDAADLADRQPRGMPADTVGDRAADEAQRTAIADAVQGLTGRMRTVAEAAITNPDHNTQQLAEALGVHRDTVTRTLDKIREDPTFRELAALTDLNLTRSELENP